MMLDTSVPSHSHPDEEVEAEPESRIELNALKNVDQIKEAFSLLSKEEV